MKYVYIHLILTTKEVEALELLIKVVETPDQEELATKILAAIEKGKA